MALLREPGIDEALLQLLSECSHQLHHSRPCKEERLQIKFVQVCIKVPQVPCCHRKCKCRSSTTDTRRVCISLMPLMKGISSKIIGTPLLWTVFYAPACKRFHETLYFNQTQPRQPKAVQWERLLLVETGVALCSGLCSAVALNVPSMWTVWVAGARCTVQPNLMVMVVVMEHRGTLYWSKLFCCSGD